MSLVIGGMIWGQSLTDTIFGPSKSIHNRQIFPIYKTYTKSDVFNIDLPLLSDLAISGNISFREGRFGFVRLVMEDEVGNEYLLLEENKWFSEMPEFEFSERCIETRMLNNVHAMRLKVICKNATITIKQLSYVVGASYDEKMNLQIRKQQIQAWCDMWNAYNRKQGQMWYAYVDESRSLSYRDIKFNHGDVDDFIPDGIDLYSGGIFVLWDFDNDSISPFAKSFTSKALTSSPFIGNFDWRNRHGRSWVTPIKNQTEPYDKEYGNGGCWAFSACATVESAYRLYFNRIDNINLSEQELGSCTSGNLHTGGSTSTALNYIKNTGVSIETCFPFQNNCTIPCSDKCSNPQEVVRINNYTSVANNPDSLKSALIHYGPIASGFYNSYYSHAMELVGYKIINAGDQLEYIKPNSASIDTIIPANSPYVGQTCWIFKNSFGTTGMYNGFMYALFENFSMMYNQNDKILMPIYSLKYTTDSVICADRDGDGYYFWGLGPKPANCPACCPDEPDGDDGDPSVGPIDYYGHPITYLDPYGDIIISHDTTISNGDWHPCENIRITNNAIVTLTNTASISLSGHSSIFLDSGKFIIDGGTVNKARIKVANNAKLILRNNAIINLGTLGYVFSEPNGMIEDDKSEIRTDSTVQDPYPGINL